MSSNWTVDTVCELKLLVCVRACARVCAYVYVYVYGRRHVLRARECMLKGFCVCVCVRACIYVCVFVSGRAYMMFDVILKLHVLMLHEPVFAF